MDKRTRKYIRAYQWSNIFAMIRNSSRDSKTYNAEFKNKLVVITGATSGIGYQVAKKFASKGANLLCVNRNPDKSEVLKQKIENTYEVECNYLIADLSKLKDLHQAAKVLQSLDTAIDVLIHNAGVYLTRRELTSDNLEKVLVVHYLSSFIINYILMDKLMAQDKARILLINSEGHRFAAWGLNLDDLNWQKRSYSGLKSYGSAKLAQLLSMTVFDQKFKESGVTINAMHPGAVKTETGQDNGPLYRWIKRNLYDRFLKSAELSAEAIYYLCVSNETEKVSGKFFNLTQEEEPTPPALDKEEAYKLWEKSLELGQLN